MSTGSILGPVRCGCDRRVPDATIGRALWQRRGLVCSACGARMSSRELVKLLFGRMP